jgi:hypothetical protein
VARVDVKTDHSSLSTGVEPVYHSGRRAQEATSPCGMPKLCSRRESARFAGETASGIRHAREAATNSSFGLGSPQALHRQTCANTSDQPHALTLALSHSLHYA